MNIWKLFVGGWVYLDYSVISGLFVSCQLSWTVKKEIEMRPLIGDWPGPDRSLTIIYIFIWNLFSDITSRAQSANEDLWPWLWYSAPAWSAFFPMIDRSVSGHNCCLGSNGERIRQFLSRPGPPGRAPANQSPSSDRPIYGGTSFSQPRLIKLE